MAFLLKHKVWVVVLIAIMVRVAFLFAFSSTLNFELEGNAIHGSEAYDEYALNLLDTGVYGREAGEPDAAIPPLYSYVLAVVYGIFGRGFIQVGLLHTLFDVLSIIMLYHIARLLFKQGNLWGAPAGEWVGALSGLMFALYPYLVFQNLTLIDTPFWIVVLHAYVLLMVLIREHEGWDRRLWLYIVLGGLVLGLSILTRPIIPVFAILAAIWFLFRLNLWQTILRLAPVAIIGAAVVIPWVIRNYGIYDDFVPMTTTSGANLWQGTSPWTIPVFRAGYDVQWTAPDLPDDLDGRDADAERFRLSGEFLRENPDKIFELYWVKFLVHWSIPLAPRYNPQPLEQWELSDDGELIIVQGERDIDGVTDANVSYNSGLYNRVARPVHMLYFGGLFMLAIIGQILSLRQWREVSLLIFVQIGMTVMYMLFHPATRYRAPSDPLLFVFSAFTIVLFLQWWVGRGKATI